MSKNNDVKLFLSFVGFFLTLFWLNVPVLEASPIDNLRREAAKLERQRDCEGAYKKYEELLEASKTISSIRIRQSLQAFISTKLAKLKPCYEKCNPTPDELDYLNRVKTYREKGQNRRAYRILLRLLRGKNPRCKTWREAHQWRRELRALMPRRHRSRKQVDPCDMEEQTRRDFEALKRRIESLKKHVIKASQPLAMPRPPRPPRWARTRRQKRRWLRYWKRRMRRKMRRKRERHELKRLRESLALFNKISQAREEVFNWREEFQDCDRIYTDLKMQSRALKQAQERSHKVIVGIYSSRIKNVKRKMRWFARQYWKYRKNQKTDDSTVEALKEALARQKEMLDNVTQDLLSLSSLLIFKTDKKREGSLLDNSADALQKLMTDQTKLFDALKKRYPQYLQTADGRRQLQQHLTTLERFEKVLERFQSQQPDENGKISKTLLAVRASIALLEKAEEKLAQQPVVAASSVSSSPSYAPQRRSSWGWILLLSGVFLGLLAVFFIIKERRAAALAEDDDDFNSKDLFS